LVIETWRVLGGERKESERGKGGEKEGRRKKKRQKSPSIRSVIKLSSKETRTDFYRLANRRLDPKEERGGKNLPKRGGGKRRYASASWNPFVIPTFPPLTSRQGKGKKKRERNGDA